jgi:type II secretion system protein H
MKAAGPSMNRAFTLIELMVVIVLIGIAMAIVIPEMRGSYDDAKLRSTARQLADAFTAANSHAIARQETCRVRIDPALGRYAIEEPKQGRESAPQPADFPGSTGEFDKKILVQVMKSEEAEPSEPEEGIKPEHGDLVSFYADGTADANQVLLRDRQGFRLLLRINPVTSRVHVEEVPRQ